ncbi:MAG: hypothetical protein HWE30_17315 [Methylocystaceae bacterium]|nr:hypothetical protein [Methylocystaceae bacterium]
MSSPSTKDAETIFQALDQLDHLLSATDETPQKVGFNELFSYAHNPKHVPSPALNNALMNDLSVRRDLKRLLSKQALAHLPRAAAASTGDIVEREADGFRLTLKVSKADETQIYLLIEAIDRSESPSLVFVQEEDGPIYRLVIDDFYDGEAQILLQSDNEVLKALRKAKSEVILR